MRVLFRQFIAGMFASLVVAGLWAEAAQPKETFALSSGRKAGDIDRVAAMLEVGGHVIGVADGKVRREKMSVVCRLAYDEKTLEAPTGPAGRWASIRYYDKATAVVKVGDDGLKPTLRARRRLIGVETDSQKATLFSPRGPLTRDELELIDVLGNSLLLDRFLPEQPAEVGQSWKHSDELIAALLGLDEVGHSDVKSVLKEVTPTAARFEMAGRLDGAIDGVSTKIELKGKYRFDRRSRRIDWFTMLVNENRNSSPVADGVDVVARVQVRISPKTESGRLTDAALKDLPLEPTAALCQLSYESVGGNWRLTHDRCWHVTGSHRDLAVLRLIDRGEYVAQCKVSPLRKLAAGEQVSLAEFQEDVRKALGEDFGEFVEAGQSASDAGYRVYRVMVRGEASQLPIRWNYYLVTDEYGHRAVFAFSFESRLADRFDQADRKLVSSLRFLEPNMGDWGLGIGT